MFYKIKSPYALRGWEKMTCVLVKRPQNNIKNLKSEEFQCLTLCDGETDLEAAGLQEEFQGLLDKFLEVGIIEKLDEPAPLDEEQYYHFFDNRYMRSVFWSVTGRCNYHCRHCYMDAPEGALGEVSTETALDFIDQMAACGVMRVDITGGEPFVREDFWQLIDRMVSYKMWIGMVYTNGWLLTGEVLDEFEKRGLHPDFSLSFDGVGWHDWMRRVPGAEEAALRAMRLCKERGFYANVEMCVHRGNKDTLPETVAALKEVGVTDIKTGNVSLTDLWCKNSEGNELTFAEYAEVMIDYIPKFFETGRPASIMLTGVVSLYPKDSEKPYSIIPERYDGVEEHCLDCHLCGAVRSSCYITPEGRLLPCMPMTSAPQSDQEKFPLIQDIGLKKGLSDSYYMQYVDSRVKDLLAANAECAACEYKYKCGGGCRASALLEGDHDLMGPDRSQCMLWREGYVDRIRQTADAAIAKYCPKDE